MQEDGPSKPPEVFHGEFRINLGLPMEIVQFAPEINGSNSESLEHSRLVGKALKAYKAELKTLIQEKYASQLASLPQWMLGDSKIIVIVCPEGILVRYERTNEEPKVLCGASEQSLGEILFALSENVIQVGTLPTSIQPLAGPTLKLEKVNTETGEKTEIFSAIPRIGISIANLDSLSLPKPPARPPCLISIPNEFNLMMEGVVDSTEVQIGLNQPPQQRFLTKSTFPLPVGWLAVEIYPKLDQKYWNSEFAATWAELDILAAIARKNLSDGQLRAIDSRGETRKRYASLLKQFEELLEGLEEPVHQFVKRHPELIAPTCEKNWSKLPFGDRISDFVIRESFNDYQLVELEAPIRELFRKDGQQKQELTHAINQILDWVVYIANNKARVEDELGLTGISTSPRMLIVIGRSNSLNEDNRQKLTAIQNSNPKLRILTYDDLLANARANLERILGPLGMDGDDSEIYFYNSNGTAST